MRRVLKSILSAYAAVLGLVAAVVFIILYMIYSDKWSLPNTTLARESARKTAPVILSKSNAKQINCLALNIYFEARGSSLADKAAVADVVINRSEDRRYPNTPCGVISQGVMPDRTDCQFSWKCDENSNTPAEQDSWDQAKTIAHNMYMNGEYRGITEGATHYHATHVKPYWAKSLQLVGRIGSHVYYRWE